MSKRFIPIVLILVFFLPGTVSASVNQPPMFMGYTSFVRKDPPVSPFDVNCPIVYKNKLQTNPSVSFRTAIRGDEPIGIQHLRYLSLYADLEEHWVFLPKRNIWLEVSFAETALSATIDFDFLEDLIKNNDELAIYHIHLRNYLKQVKEKQDRYIPETWLSVPSFADIALMIYFNSHFNAQHPQGAISWNICSPLGLTTYALTDKGREQYMTPNSNAFLLTYFYPCNDSSINSKTVPMFNLSAPHKVDELVKWVSVQGKNCFDIKFFPYSGQRKILTADIEESVEE